MMHFTKENQSLSFEEFSKTFSKEAKVLTEHLQQNVNFLIEGNKISLVHGEFNPIDIQVENILKKHEVYFYKNSIYKEPLAKAIGLKKGKERPVVLDATAGLLGDSLLMYAFGLKQLICFERNPIAATLITNALSLADTTIDFHYGMAQDAELHESIDVVFYDPMYKEKNQKVAPRKEMAIFREIIGPDEDILETAKYLSSLARERLVIKRPNMAAPILENPHHSFKGKSTSYDVYLSLK